MSTEDSSAAVRGSGFSAGLGALVERLRTDVLWHRRRGNETIARDCQEAADMLERLEPMDMALCERHSLVLRVGQPYVFRPVGNCESCAEALKQAREAYGPSAGAPNVRGEAWPTARTEG